MREFALIARYCQSVGVTHKQTRIAVGDDAAVFSVAENREVVVSMDTMVEGVHFLADTDAADLAHKILAVNLSDMAAMGAQPKWALLALTLPQANDAWLHAFSEALHLQAQLYGVQLIGGDTTQGPLTLSMTIIGEVQKSKVLTRSGAKVGDDVYISNVVGDAPLALHYVQRGDSVNAALLQALHRPKPQCELGQNLLGLANACIDISDGLLADLTHIAKNSAVSIRVDIEKIPVSTHYEQYLEQSGDMRLALSGGDDYQLVFTAPSSKQEQIQALANKLDMAITKIGAVLEVQAMPMMVFEHGKTVLFGEDNGYQHFKR